MNIYHRNNIQPNELIGSVCRRGSLEDIKELHAMGFNFNIAQAVTTTELISAEDYENNYTFPLAEAARHFNVDVLEYLLKDCKVNPNSRDLHMQTALFGVFSNKNMILDELRKEGRLDRVKKTIGLLIDYGASLYIYSNPPAKTETLYNAAFDLYGFFSEKNNDLRMKVSEAIDVLDKSMVSEIEVDTNQLDSSDSVSSYDEESLFALDHKEHKLMTAAMCNDSLAVKGNPDWVQRVSIMPALFLAVQHNNVDFVREVLNITPSLLLSAETLPNFSSKSYVSLFEHAYAHNNKEMLSVLIDIGNENKYNWQECAPSLLKHCWKGIYILDTAKIFMENGISPFKVETFSSGGRETTALHEYVQQDSVDIVRVVIENFADESVDMVDDSGRTPLYSALEIDNNIEIAKLLIEAGADSFVELNIDDEDSATTPFDITDSEELISIMQSNYLTGIHDDVANPPVTTSKKF